MNFSELKRGQEARLDSGVFAKWQKLRELAVSKAKLHPEIDDWIILHGFNPTGGIDPSIENEAAMVMREVFKASQPDIILGIGNSGLPFAERVKKEFPRAEYKVVKKLGAVSRGMEIDGIKYTVAPSRSHQGKLYVLEMPEIDAGTRTLIIDDFGAHGSTIEAVIKAARLQNARIVGAGLMADKNFLGGFQRVCSELKVPGFSIIRIASTNRNNGPLGQIVLMDEKNSLKIV
ncbi:hypothetical protein A2954_06860 [Candidatus Roizmanbacteria bacterium RIFCSPLOWO2_01_FULL_37_12]|uniref:Phosphoribosyltransferase domain-containing protein n=1 Tax=Candidatus Roizmanbacteria bacterium RIFCSPLOWO2_01_FULL_37_12 TaxID=1802056 RepID=A0A1F7ID92_9BACT|nr:MAG: hypothetical protein A3D76_03110 [Candidatus Roizmanbacteria bacterium RIFCSPHIGHO2_02_FULL_37_9b]OGK41311.1 MAG: hypothetical protein A2954_06860 [Candidatus Roizmanbacteria bacterium RIFCSPLOWO2_01_FULL_37_12]